MRRLLELGTLLFLSALVLAPLAECFDRWDPPGLSDDTEFAVCALLLLLCLVLVVMRQMSAVAMRVDLDSRRYCALTDETRRADASLPLLTLMPPLYCSPLRI